MIPPPEHGFKREANAPQESLNTLQKVVRFAEKDDLLLYMTAAFGVLMPGIMYFFYRYIHSRYQQRKKEEKQQGKRHSEKQRSATIFYCNDIPETREIAYELAENLKYDPLVAKLGANELEKAHNSKAMLVFVLSREVKQKQKATRLGEFIEWLDEVKYERREKNYLRGTRFITLFVEMEGGPEEEAAALQTILSLERRICSLESIPLGQAEIVDKDKKQLKGIRVKLDDLLRRFNYGEFDAPEMSGEESLEECSEDDGSE